MFILLILLSVDVTVSKRDIMASINSTTCDEFIKGSVFDESRILDVDWKVFYMWCMNYEEPYQVRYRKASPTLVERFSNVIDGHVSPPVNWNETAFFMESTLDLSALFIRTDTNGKYRVISSLVLQHDLPVVIFAMKIVEPGYLGFMNCDVPSCVALAPADKMPRTSKLAEAAELLKVNSPFGYPYTEREDILQIHNQVLPDNNDDADDEEELEVEMFGSSLMD